MTCTATALAGSISGTLSLAGGGTAAGKTVRAIGQPYGFPTVNTITDTSGNFTLSGLSAGCYIVVATDSTLGTVAYPSAIFASKATVINVGASDNVTAINFAFLTGHMISGNLSGSPGPLPGTETVLLMGPLGEASLLTSTTTISSFTLNHIPDGSYLLFAKDSAAGYAEHLLRRSLHGQRRDGCDRLGRRRVGKKHHGHPRLQHIKGHVAGATINQTVRGFRARELLQYLFGSHGR